jgi:hypothetical protein
MLVRVASETVLLVGRIKLLSRGETDLVLVLLGKILGVCR